MDTPRKLLLANKAWRTEMMQLRSDYFLSLAQGQKPSCLWIGCSDSRVPAEEITGSRPGELFVHRNVANLVHPDDINLMSVVDYAVNFLMVEHVIICGHKGCGGVQAALTDVSSKVIQQWIKPIRAAIAKNEPEFAATPTLADRVDLLAQMNVKNQVIALSQSQPIRQAWLKRKSPVLHGWIFDLKHGSLEEVASLDPFIDETAIPREEHGFSARWANP